MQLDPGRRVSKCKGTVSKRIDFDKILFEMVTRIKKLSLRLERLGSGRLWSSEKPLAKVGVARRGKKVSWLAELETEYC